MLITEHNEMGMDLLLITHKSCSAKVGEGDDWATIYFIESEEKNQGHGTELILQMKRHFERKGKKFGSSVALSEAMAHLLTKLNIPEYA